MLSPDKVDRVYRRVRESRKLHSDLKDFGRDAMERSLVDRPCKTEAESHMCTWLRRRRDKKRRVDEMWTYPPDWGGSGAQSPASLTESEDDALVLEHSDNEVECESEEECKSEEEQEEVSLVG